MTSLPVTWLHVTSFLVRAASGYVISSSACTMARSPLLPPKYALSCPDILLWYLDLGGTLWITHKKVSKDGKVLSHLGFKSKVLPRPLTDLSAWVDFCTSSPQQGVKYQLWYLKKKWGREVSLNIPWKIYQGLQSSCPLPRWNNTPQSHSRVSNINFDIWIWGGTLWISLEKLPKHGKVLCYLGFKSTVLPRPLTDVNA